MQSHTDQCTCTTFHVNPQWKYVTGQCVYGLSLSCMMYQWAFQKILNLSISEDLPKGVKTQILIFNWNSPFNSIFSYLTLAGIRHQQLQLRMKSPSSPWIIVASLTLWFSYTSSAGDGAVALRPPWMQSAPGSTAWNLRKTLERCSQPQAGSGVCPYLSPGGWVLPFHQDAIILLCLSPLNCTLIGCFQIVVPAGFCTLISGQTQPAKA